MAYLAIASVLAGVTLQREAHANPIAVAEIGAAAVIGGAVITATGAIVAASIVATGAIVVAAINNNNNNNNNPSGSGGSGGGQRLQSESSIAGGTVSTLPGSDLLHFGAEALPESVRSFMDRELTLRTSEVALPDGTRVISADADFELESDVSRTAPDVRVLNVRDGITFRFDVANVERASDVQLQLRVKRLLLSTEDTAQTEGHAQLRFTATQDGRPLWSFVARTDQGAEPELSGPPELRTATVRRESGRLLIENLTMPIAYEAPGASGSTRVEVVLSYEGEDARI